MAACGLLAVMGSLVAAAAWAPDPIREPGTCPAASQDSALLQAGLVTRQAGGRSGGDCARRLNEWGQRNSACVVVRGGRALLVWVPYGSAPGWDLPGGNKKSGEAGCQTAERETCEESGYRVRAVEKLSYNVFKCEYVASNACRNPVDEGFLAKRWVGPEELSRVQYRGGTWGDKEGLIRRALASGTSPSPGADPSRPDWADACGCRMCFGEGFSGTRQQCGASSVTAPNEACDCLRRQGGSLRDACGCRACDGEGWSSTARRCRAGSETSPAEGCQCQRDGGRPALSQIA